MLEDDWLQDDWLPACQLTRVELTKLAILLDLPATQYGLFEWKMNRDIHWALEGAVSAPVARQAQEFARRLTDARRDLLKLERLLGGERPNPKLKTSLTDAADHLRGAFFAMSMRPRRRKRSGVSGHPGVIHLIGLMEDSALDLGRSWSLDKNSGQGTLVRALELVRECLQRSLLVDGFFPSSHPLSTYQNELMRARRVWSRQAPLERRERLQWEREQAAKWTNTCAD